MYRTGRPAWMLYCTASICVTLDQVLSWRQIAVWVWKFLDFCIGVSEVSVLLIYGAAWLGNWWPTCRDTVQWVLRFLFQQVKRRGCAVYHSPPSADVKNKWSCTSAPPCPQGVDSDIFIFFTFQISRQTSGLRRHFDPCRWDHYIISKGHASVTHWRSATSQNSSTMWLLLLPFYRRLSGP